MASLLAGAACAQNAAGQKVSHGAAWREQWRREWRREWKKSAAHRTPQKAAANPAPTALIKTEDATQKPEIKPDTKAVEPLAPPRKSETSPSATVAKPLPAPLKAESKVEIKKTERPAVSAVTAAPAAPKPVPAGVAAKPATPTTAPKPVAPTAAQPAAKPVTPAASPAPAAAAVPANAALVDSPPVRSPLAETRPDPAAETKKSADKPLDSPLSAVGDGGKMFLYLIPTVLLMVGALHLLRRFQEKTGRLPAAPRAALTRKSSASPPPKTGGLLQTLLDNANRSKTPEQPSAIRVVESVPMGESQLHLIEVRGRSLLIGANANGVNLLTEVEESDELINNEFRLMLEQAAGEIGSLDIADNELPSSLLIGTLDDPLRDAGRAVARGTRRLRTVRETEAAWEDGKNGEKAE